jgi:signal transduction histidine kinase
VVVLATAERLRSREQHESWRLGVTVVVVTALVALFGGLARRRQRRQLDLERRIAISTLERERETLLAKADKMAALAALSTGIAHEVGTPLGIIVGRIEQVLARSSGDERVASGLKIVLEQVSRIRAIVSGCLALARGEAGLRVQTAPGTVAKHAIDLVRHRFHSAGVGLTWEIEVDLPNFACDPSLFEQALVNLLLNACQATPRGGEVRLHVSRAHNQVVFVVEDDGSGIPDEIAQRATEPFFSTRREEGGSGLGLTIAREIVNHHGGSLALARRDDHGTRATIAINA